MFKINKPYQLMSINNNVYYAYKFLIKMPLDFVFASIRAIMDFAKAKIIILSVYT